MTEPLATALVFAGGLVAGWVVWHFAHDGAPPKGDGWLKWALLVMGMIVGLDVLLDREQKVDFKQSNRVEGLKHLLGPTAFRIVFGTLAGGILGGALSLFLG